MSPQADYVVSNGTGAAVRSDINGQLAAIVSNNSGASAPATTYAYMLWADTSTNLLKLRNGANSAWITVGDLTAANLGLAALASPTFTGTVTIPTATISTGAGIPLGSAASPAIYFTGDTNTGIYSPGADQIAFTTGGTGRAFIDSSGRLGLGNSSPISYNASASDLVVGNHTGAHGVTICSQNNSSGYIMFADGTTGAQTYAGQITYDHTNNRLTLGTGDGTTGLTVDSSQRVGIGTTAPESLVHINGDATALRITRGSSIGFLYSEGTSTTSTFRVQANGGPLDLYSGSSQPITFSAATSEKARIDSSGRLLVGTSSAPTVSDAQYGLLRTQGNSSSSSGFGLVSIARGEAPTSITSGEEIGYVYFTANDGSAFASIECRADGTAGSGDYPGRLAFSTTADGASSPTERFRIANTGRGSYFCSSSSGFQISCSPAASNSDNIIEGLYSATGVTTGTLSYVVRTNGNVLNTNNSYTGLSDLKLKENIVDANSQWNDIKNLLVRNYNFKEGQTHRQIGLVAQEVEQICPGLVDESPDRDADGNDLGTVTKSVNYSVLYMKAVKALQEAMERIEALEAKVAALEAS